MSYELSDASSTIRERMIHPNAEEDDKFHGVGRAKSKDFSYYWKRCDEFLMKPIFVHKYEKELIKASKEFYEMMAHDGKAIEEKFVNQQSLLKKDNVYDS